MVRNSVYTTVSQDVIIAQKDRVNTLGFRLVDVSVTAAYQQCLPANRQRWAVILPLGASHSITYNFNDQSPTNGQIYLNSASQTVWITANEIGPLITLPLWVKGASAGDTIEVAEIYILPEYDDNA